MPGLLQGDDVDDFFVQFLDLLLELLGPRDLVDVSFGDDEFHLVVQGYLVLDLLKMPVVLYRALPRTLGLMQQVAFPVHLRIGKLLRLGIQPTVK